MLKFNINGKNTQPLGMFEQAFSGVSEQRLTIIKQCLAVNVNSTGQVFSENWRPEILKARLYREFERYTNKYFIGYEYRPIMGVATYWVRFKQKKLVQVSPRFEFKNAGVNEDRLKLLTKLLSQKQREVVMPFTKYCSPEVLRAELAAELNLYGGDYDISYDCFEIFGMTATCLVRCMLKPAAAYLKAKEDTLAIGAYNAGFYF